MAIYYSLTCICSMTTVDNPLVVELLGCKFLIQSTALPIPYFSIKHTQLFF